MRASIATFLLVLAALSRAIAQQVPIDPATTHIFPPGGQRGTIVEVLVGGQCLPPNSRLHWFGEGIKSPAVLGGASSGHYEPSPRRDPRETPMFTSKQWASSIEIAADAPLGQKLWRVSSGRGGTSARPFIVGQLPEIIEKESNSSPEKAQHVPLGVTINGQIAGERDVDYFEFSAETGETITAAVAAARLGSPLETVIELHDARGRAVPSHELRAGSDPVLVCRIPASGQYRLFVANLSFRGGPEFVYRITLSRAPYIQFTFPPLAQAGQPREIEAFLSFGQGPLEKRAGTLLAPSQPSQYWLASPIAAANSIEFESTALPALVEREPNDSRQQAMELAPDVLVAGQLATPSDEDWFQFTARKDELFSIACKPAPKSSPALPVVAVVDAAGSMLANARSPDAVDRVAQLDWRAPADGTYHLRVADIEQGAAGGPESTYCLSVEYARPDFTLTSKTDFLNVVHDGRAELELSVARRGGFDRPIELAVEGLPEGVRFEPREIPPDAASIKIAFIAAADARPTSASVKLVGGSTIDGRTCSRTLTATHLGHDSGGVGLGPSTVDTLQLTVAHKPVFKLYCSEAYQYAHRGTVYPYAMQVERLDGFDGPIHLEVADRQIKDLDGAMVREMTVEPGVTSFMLPLYLPETMHINKQAHSNIYAQGYVTFVDKWGQPQSHLVVSTMRCMVRTLPPVAKLEAVDRRLSARPGATLDCRLHVVRTSNFSGPMTIELAAASEAEGYRAEPVVAATGQPAVSIAVQIPDSKPAAETQLTFRATGSMAGNVQVVSEATVALDFE